MGTRGWVLGLVLTAALACGLDGRRAGHQDDAEPEFSADRLGLNDHDAIFDLLEPEEREAFARSHMSGTGDGPGASSDTSEGKADTAGKVGLSVLTVALSVGAAVAPFFLF
jgi:hypothetical protein